jgi:hypothetical protein
MLRITGRLKDSNVINLPAEWKGKVDVDSIIVQLTPCAVAQELFVKSIDYGQRVLVQSQSGTNVNCYYSVEAEELSQG